MAHVHSPGPTWLERANICGCPLTPHTLGCIHAHTHTRAHAHTLGKSIKLNAIKC